METVNYKLISSVNREILEAQAKNEELINKFEKLSINKTLKYINFKVVGGAFALGILFCAVPMSVYIHSLKDVVKIKTVEIPIKTEVQIPVEKKVYVKVKNPVNQELQEENKYLNEQIEELNADIKNLKTKVLPSKYYCSLTSGKNGICVAKSDSRFIDNVDDGIFVELK